MGQAIVQTSKEKVSVFPFTRNQCDITRIEQLQAAFDSVRPDAVIHCAAYTAVDKAESEPENCNEVNVHGTENVVEMCIRYNDSIMLLSTDYVFDGSGSRPYEISDPRHPVNQYGISKAKAEDIVLQAEKSYVVRTSWMFGAGQNFVRTIIELARKNKDISVVNDQIGSPTYSEDLAPLLVKIISDGKYGIYHATNEGICSWTGLAEESLRLMKIGVKVKQIPSCEFNAAAKRPLNSRLSKKSLDGAGYLRLPEWHDALERYIRKYGADI